MAQITMSPIYVRLIVSGKPTEIDAVGCDGMYIENTEICTEEITQLREDLDAVIAVYNLTQRDMESARRKWHEHKQEKDDDIKSS